MEKVAFDFWEWKNVEETEVVSQSFIRERNSRERPDNYLKAKLVRHFWSDQQDTFEVASMVGVISEKRTSGLLRP